MRPTTESASGHTWTFLTNHSHVLICLYKDPHMRLSDVANAVGITERAVQRIVMELEAVGVLAHTREGRRNVYTVTPHQPLRHPVEGHCTVNQLLEMVSDPKPTKSKSKTRK